MVFTLKILERHGYKAVFTFSSILNLLVVYGISSPMEHIGSDMGGYIYRAWRMASYGGISPFDAFYPAGTSYFFSVVFSIFGFGNGLYAIAILQALFLASSNVLVGAIAELLFGNKKVALNCALFSTLYWPFLSLNSNFMAEPLFIFLTLLSFYLYVRAMKPPSRLGVTTSETTLLGVIIGLALLVKGQALAILATFLSLPFFLSTAKHLRCKLWTIVIGAAFPVLCQFAVLTALSGSPSFYLAANDAYNLYLGQSRNRAVGCINPDNGARYIFHNNNAGLHYDYLPVEWIEKQIVDREFFLNRSRTLLFDNPGRQLIISLQNAVELFSINPHWPARNIPLHRKMNTVFQYFFLCFAIFPCLYTLCAAIFKKRYVSETLLLALPVLGLTALSMVTMGQPRYLIPFRYYLIVMAVPFYLDLKACFALKNTAFTRKANSATKPNAETMQ